MAGASTGFHESEEKLSDHTRDMHRALVSVQEELEAIDWYRQRADACTDAELREILLHNMREEVEHAMMLLEWLRRNSPEFEQNMKVYLFKSVPITQIEAEEEGRAESSAEASRETESRPAATIGSLKGA